MRAAAGLACLALLVGCAPSHEPGARSALQFSPDLAEDFGSLPRVAGDTPQTRAINAALDRVDARDRENRASCLEMKPWNDNVEWGRTVDAPMTGPRYVSIVMSQGDYCGGAHPWWNRTALVFDLETGRLIDWTAWLPAEMATPIKAEEADRWVRPAFLESPSLKAWFAERVLAGMDEYGRRECSELYAEDQRDEWGLTAWPDAKGGGLTLQSAGLVHADMGCHGDVLMPLSELKRRGVAPELVEAIEAGHRAGLWRDAPPESAGTDSR